MLRTGLKKIVTIQNYGTRTATNICPLTKDEDPVPPLKSWKNIPGPSSLPGIGILFHFIPGIGSLAVDGKKNDLMTDKLYERFGRIVRLDGSIFNPTLILLYDPEAISQVLRGENQMPNRPGFQSFEYYRKVHSKKINSEDTTFKGTTGLITEHGEKWKEFRMTVNPIMMQPKTVKLYYPAIDSLAKDMIKRLKELRDNDNMIQDNLNVELNKWALESIAVVALGGRLGIVGADLPQNSPASRLMKSVHDIHNTAQLMDFQPSLWRYFPTKAFKQTMKIYENQISLSRYFIKRAVKDIESRRGTTSQEEKGVLEKLLEIDENVAVIMATDMLFAGIDTVSNTMLATMYLLAINPGKQEKLRQEILSEDENGSYLRACIKESLRMLPVASGNIRKTTKEYNLCGYQIPKDMFIMFRHQYLANMETQYIRAKEFLPERFLVDKSDPLHYSNAHPFAMSPFGFGVRQCIGMRIAHLEFEIFIKNLLKNFRLEWTGGPPNITPTTMNYFSGPYKFVFKDL